jgi:tetratricopeptide (TPR) repeat protein
VTEPDDWEAQVAEYDELVSDLSEATTLEDRDWLAWALISHGEALEKLGRAKEALASYEEVVARFDDAPEVELHARVASALGRSARALLELKRPEEALAACDALLSRFAENSDARFLPSISYGVLLRGRALWTLGRKWEAAETNQRHLRDFSPASFEALFGLARSLSQLGCHEEAVAAIDEYLTAIGDSSEPVDPWWIAYLLLARARHLIVLGKLPKALASCEEVIELLSGAVELELRASLAGALLRKAAILALDEQTAEVGAALDQVTKLRHEGEQLLVNFEPDELEALQPGLARLSGELEAFAGEPDLVTFEGEGGNIYGFELIDFRDIPDDLRDLD